jgi:hypothetical protein
MHSVRRGRLGHILQQRRRLPRVGEALRVGVLAILPGKESALNEAHCDTYVYHLFDSVWTEVGGDRTYKPSRFPAESTHA